MTTTTTTGGVCGFNITINRNRLKTYGNHVYLKDGQQFEIELNNPLYFNVLAKIKINGFYISNAGIVLKPGQRVYLERFIDKDERFMFSTYTVDDTIESKNAIVHNGDIEIEYYAQKIVSTYVYPKGNTYTYYNDLTVGGTTSMFSNTNMSTTVNASLSSTPIDSVETGRIEGGDSSGQTFEVSNLSFFKWSFNKQKIKILPVSEKPIEVNELRNYCTNCGTRAKKASWKFCPSCGTKI